MSSFITLSESTLEPLQLHKGQRLAKLDPLYLQRATMKNTLRIVTCDFVATFAPKLKDEPQGRKK